jgi:hypothetical protein
MAAAGAGVRKWDGAGGGGAAELGVAMNIWYWGKMLGWCGLRLLSVTVVTHVGELFVGVWWGGGEVSENGPRFVWVRFAPAGCAGPVGGERGHSRA